jgi:hypothetical protein
MKIQALFIIMFAVLVAADTASIALSPFAIVVCANPVVVGNPGKTDLNKLGFDSIPFLTLDDIQSYLIDYTASRHMLVLSPFFPRERIENRLHDLYEKPFVVMVQGIPVYGGEFVPVTGPLSYRHLFVRPLDYEGPYIEVPVTLNSDSIEIKFRAPDGMYDEKDDPRLDQRVLDVFEKNHKLKKVFLHQSYKTFPKLSNAR